MIYLLRKKMNGRLLHEYKEKGFLREGFFFVAGNLSEFLWYKVVYSIFLAHFYYFYT